YPEEAPQHGFRGDSSTGPAARIPGALTVAISREAGARGGTIGRRAGRKLGWQVYDQELLEYLAQDASACQGMVDALHAESAAWVETQLTRLWREQSATQDPSVLGLARVVLSLGAQGSVVLIGRGAGCILPPESTLHVRIVAPLDARIAYMGQWLRLTSEEAAERVRLRDERRSDFVATHFHRQPNDIYQYDLLLNSTLLGEEVCADLIARAAQARDLREDSR